MAVSLSSIHGTSFSTSSLFRHVDICGNFSAMQIGSDMAKDVIMGRRMRHGQSVAEVQRVDLAIFWKSLVKNE